MVKSLKIDDKTYSILIDTSYHNDMRRQIWKKNLEKEIPGFMICQNLN